MEEITWQSAAQGIPTYSDRGESLWESGDDEETDYNPKVAGGYTERIRARTRFKIQFLTTKSNNYGKNNEDSEGAGYPG